ncbi:unnamed protein product [Amoebophrya sp. A120]|nr:unnamed protein product [Amoebophrya sp. A120]|eukprot:GSA120T00024538001.1
MSTSPTTSPAVKPSDRLNANNRLPDAPTKKKTPAGAPAFQPKAKTKVGFAAHSSGVATVAKNVVQHPKIVLQQNTGSTGADSKSGGATATSASAGKNIKNPKSSTTSVAAASSLPKTLPPAVAGNIKTTTKNQGKVAKQTETPPAGAAPSTNDKHSPGEDLDASHVSWPAHEDHEDLDHHETIDWPIAGDSTHGNNSKATAGGGGFSPKTSSTGDRTQDQEHLHAGQTIKQKQPRQHSRHDLSSPSRSTHHEVAGNAPLIEGGESSEEQGQGVDEKHAIVPVVYDGHDEDHGSYNADELYNVEGEEEEFFHDGVAADDGFYHGHGEDHDYGYDHDDETRADHDHYNDQHDDQHDQHYWDTLRNHMHMYHQHMQQQNQETRIEAEQASTNNKRNIFKDIFNALHYFHTSLAHGHKVHYRDPDHHEEIQQEIREKEKARKEKYRKARFPTDSHHVGVVKNPSLLARAGAGASAKNSIAARSSRSSAALDRLKDVVAHVSYRVNYRGSSSGTSTSSRKSSKAAALDQAREQADATWESFEEMHFGGGVGAASAARRSSLATSSTPASTELAIIPFGGAHDEDSTSFTPPRRPGGSTWGAPKPEGEGINTSAIAGIMARRTQEARAKARSTDAAARRTARASERAIRTAKTQYAREQMLESKTAGWAAALKTGGETGEDSSEVVRTESEEKVQRHQQELQGSRATGLEPVDNDAEEEAARSTHGARTTSTAREHHSSRTAGGSLSATSAAGRATAGATSSSSRIEALTRKSLKQGIVENLEYQDEQQRMASRSTAGGAHVAHAARQSSSSRATETARTTSAVRATARRTGSGVEVGDHEDTTRRSSSMPGGDHISTSGTTSRRSTRKKQPGDRLQLRQEEAHDAEKEEGRSEDLFASNANNFGGLQLLTRESEKRKTSEQDEPRSVKLLQTQQTFGLGQLELHDHAEGEAAGVDALIIEEGGTDDHDVDPTTRAFLEQHAAHSHGWSRSAAAQHYTSEGEAMPPMMGGGPPGPANKGWGGTSTTHKSSMAAQKGYSYSLKHGTREGEAMPPGPAKGGGWGTTHKGMAAQKGYAPKHGTSEGEAIPPMGGPGWGPTPYNKGMAGQPGGYNAAPMTADPFGKVAAKKGGGGPGKGGGKKGKGKQDPSEWYEPDHHDHYGNKVNMSETSSEVARKELDMHFYPIVSVLYPVVQIFMFYAVANKTEDSLRDYNLKYGIRAFKNRTCFLTEKPFEYSGCPWFVDIRSEAIRYVSYAFAHTDTGHLLNNIIFELLFGPSLEMVHGTARMLPLVLLAILGGSLTTAAEDPTQLVVGSSGYAYGLVAMQIANLAMNWHEYDHRYFHFNHEQTLKMRQSYVFLATILTFVLMMSFSTVQSMDGGGVSHSAHMGGAICGLLFAALFCRNVVNRGSEGKVQVACGITAAVYVMVLIIHISNSGEGTGTEAPVSLLSGQIHSCRANAGGLAAGHCCLSESKQAERCAAAAETTTTGEPSSSDTTSTTALPLP